MVLAAALVLCGCQALKTVLPIIESILIDIIDAENKTNLAEKLAHDYLKAHPDAAAEAQIDAQLAKCRQGLAVALTVTKGGTAAANGDSRAAFSAFNLAWLDLEKLVQPMGIIRVPGAEMAVPDRIMIDEPFSLRETTKP